MKNLILILIISTLGLLSCVIEAPTCKSEVTFINGDTSLGSIKILKITWPDGSITKKSYVNNITLRTCSNC